MSGEMWTSRAARTVESSAMATGRSNVIVMTLVGVALSAGVWRRTCQRVLRGEVSDLAAVP